MSEMEDNIINNDGMNESAEFEGYTPCENDGIAELVEYIARNLVDDADSVKVASKKKDDNVLIVLTVAKDDMGKVIGKQGRIAKAIRTVVRAASVKSEVKYSVEII